MKKVNYLFLAIIFATVAILSSCSSPNEKPNDAQLINNDSIKQVTIKDLIRRDDKNAVV